MAYIKFIGFNSKGRPPRLTNNAASIPVARLISPFGIT